MGTRVYGKMLTSLYDHIPRTPPGFTWATPNGPRDVLPPTPSAIQELLAAKVAYLERTNTELRTRLTEVEGQVAELLGKQE